MRRACRVGRAGTAERQRRAVRQPICRRAVYGGGRAGIIHHGIRADDIDRRAAHRNFAVVIHAAAVDFNADAVRRSEGHDTVVIKRTAGRDFISHCARGHAAGGAQGGIAVEHRGACRVRVAINGGRCALNAAGKGSDTGQINIRCGVNFAIGTAFDPDRRGIPAAGNQIHAGGVYAAVFSCRQKEGAVLAAAG